MGKQKAPQNDNLALKSGIKVMTYRELDLMYANGQTEHNIGYFNKNKDNRQTKLVVQRLYLEDEKHTECLGVTIDYFEGNRSIAEHRYTLTNDQSLLITNGYCLNCVNTELIPFLTKQGDNNVKDWVVIGFSIFAIIMVFYILIGLIPPM